MLHRVLIIIAVLGATAAAGAQPKTPTARASAPPATTTAATGTPSANATPTETTETDPVVAAAQQAMRMHERAAAACTEAIEKSVHGGPLAQAQRHLLMAAALLYNSSGQLKRVGQKEMTLAEKRTASGEQKERSATDAETDAEKAEIVRKAKANLAYGETQGAIAESLLEFAGREEELAKEADAAAMGNDAAALEVAGKKIIEQNAAARTLYEGVRETRAKLRRISP